VQLRAERAEFFNQRGFDEMMNVLGRRSVEPRGIGLRAQCDFAERRGDLLAFFFAKNPRGDDGARQARSSASSCGSMRRSKLQERSNS